MSGGLLTCELIFLKLGLHSLWFGDIFIHFPRSSLSSIDLGATNSTTTRLSVNMSEPSQSKATGIIIGVTIGVIIFLIFLLTLFHYWSRKMHRPKGSPPFGSENTSEDGESMA